MNGLTIRFDSTEVSDAEVAAVTVAVAALTGASSEAAAAGGGNGRGSGTTAPAWRAAALLEATDGRRLGSRSALWNAGRG